MEKDFKKLFDESQSNVASKLTLSADETDKFKKAFDDPEFRKLFSEYLDEMQDPSNRTETEAYISQLEKDNKIPNGKELVRPMPGYVVKTKKTGPNKDDDKVFINIVYSDKIKNPIKSTTPKGDSWSLPYSLGPPRMEKDKSGSNAVAFDCCFHPDIVLLSNDKRFQDIVVQTSLDGIVEYYRRAGQKVQVDKDYHIVKGIQYKSGEVSTMLIATDSKSKWEENDNNGESAKETKKPVDSSTGTVLTSKTEDNDLKQLPSAPIEKTVSDKPVLKKGFLLNSKSEKKPVNSLIQEISSSQQTESRSLKSIESHLPEKTIGPIAPSFTMTERGKLDLGDFEALKDKVTSNRPSEIVYRIHIPLADKPSKVHLDVSERTIALQYENIYILNITLPYPVYDKKGTAKYDKATKTLVVILPVKPHDPATLRIDSIAISESVSVVNDKEDYQSESSDSVSPVVVDKIDKNVKKEHSRWIEETKDDASSITNNTKLSDMIKHEAELAKQKYEADMINKAKDAMISQSSADLKSVETVAKIDKSLPQELIDFIPSQGYTGSKPGYVFKTGSNGVGYYIDRKSSIQHASETTSKMIESVIDGDTRLIHDVPYEYRQTKTSIAMLIQLSNIIPHSVKIEYTDRSIDVIFRVVDPNSNPSYTTYAIGYDFNGKLNPGLCKHDVVTQNMVIVAAKANDCAVLWNEKEPIIKSRRYQGDITSYLQMILPLDHMNQKALDAPSSECKGCQPQQSHQSNEDMSRSTKDNLPEELLSNAIDSSNIQEAMKQFTFRSSGLFELD